MQYSGGVRAAHKVLKRSRRGATMSGTYFTRLGEELKDLQTRADVRLDTDDQVIVGATLPRAVCADNLNVSALFRPSAWAEAECPPPDLVYWGNGKLAFLFRVARPLSTNRLVSATSSLVTTVLADPCHVCTCGATRVESRPAAFAYFLIESGAHHRAALVEAAERRDGAKRYGHLTTSELEELGPGDDYGRFYKPGAQTPEDGFVMKLSTFTYESQAKTLFD